MLEKEIELGTRRRRSAFTPQRARALTEHELRGHLRAAGLTVVGAWGDFDGSAVRPPALAAPHPPRAKPSSRRSRRRLPEARACVPLDRVPGIPALARGLATGSARRLRVPPAAAASRTSRRGGARRDAPSGRARCRPPTPTRSALARGESAAVLTGQQVGPLRRSAPHARRRPSRREARRGSRGGRHAGPRGLLVRERGPRPRRGHARRPPDSRRAEGLRPRARPLAANRAPVGALPDRASTRRRSSRAAVANLGDAARRGGPRRASETRIRAPRTRRPSRRRSTGSSADALPVVDAADAARQAGPRAARRPPRQGAARRARSPCGARRGAPEGGSSAPGQDRPRGAAALRRARTASASSSSRRAGASRSRGADGAFSEADVVARLESGAWLPSFSALTRPLAASVLYPVGATVLGPAEVAYWAQSWPLFAWAGIVPPASSLPRPSSRSRPPPRVACSRSSRSRSRTSSRARKRSSRKKGAGSARASSRASPPSRDRARADLDAARAALLAVDPSLEKAVGRDAREARLLASRSSSRGPRARAGRADEPVAQQVRRLAAELLPDGALAERVYPVLPYVLKLGRAAVVDALRRELQWDDPGLQEIAL